MRKIIVCEKCNMFIKDFMYSKNLMTCRLDPRYPIWENVRIFKEMEYPIDCPYKLEHTVIGQNETK